MATEIYLGYPPENIKKWIEKNYKPAFKLTDPLCFTAEEAGSTIKMSKHRSPPTVYLETSPTGEEGSWSDFIVCTFNEDTSGANDDGTTIILANVGDKVYFRAKQDNQQFAINDVRCNRFHMTGKIAASGNINTLLKADGSILDLTINNVDRSYCYAHMFSGCTSLTQAPELPAMTLADSCYCSMFEGCSSLIKAPELPVMTLAYACYASMFSGCRSLTQAPELPATTLAKSCYAGMFLTCSSLAQAPKLPATNLADNCYSMMFTQCKSPLTFSDKTFNEIVDLIQNNDLLGMMSWMDVENGEQINPVEIICSDKTMLASFNENENTWTLTEK